MTRITVRQVDESGCTEWDTYACEHQSVEVYHLYAWRRVLENTFGHSCYYLQAIGDDGLIRGILPLAHLKSRLFGSFLVSLPCFNYCGIIADDNTASAALISSVEGLADRLGAEHVELRHRDTTSISLPYRDDKVAMLLPLPVTEDELWQGFKPKLRAQIRRPAKEGATHVEGSADLLDDFYAVFSRNMRDLGAPVYPKRLFAEICQQFPDIARLHVVYLENKAVAAGMTVRHQGTMEIPCASSLREYNRYSVNMLLYWSILQAAIRDGCAVFDFGRSSRDAGTYRFKKQWGAEPQQLFWHYSLRNGGELPELNPQNPKYRLATRVWSHLPLTVANAIGPRIVRHLP